MTTKSKNKTQLSEKAQQYWQINQYRRYSVLGQQYEYDTAVLDGVYSLTNETPPEEVVEEVLRQAALLAEKDAENAMKPACSVYWCSLRDASIKRQELRGHPIPRVHSTDWYPSSRNAFQIRKNSTLLERVGADGFDNDAQLCIVFYFLTVLNGGRGFDTSTHVEIGLDINLA